ncbi:7-carboxy-7-deazaguanine synthase QueE [Acidianus ambivalens]|uniref:7-carboxy-7-deazaguanine synthase n=1 Tax=Acidianus ambivalens TaxID=2283 RepID=A0A650CTU9_ACIAM|nr:7-carboxy-7-deazaguanine synthase QueE [Acidianus ambivalens]MQL56191.1 radical SAM protein [Acidianus ambivalens]QGR21270.1 radical SAM protein [Acidianus ambivalens]
MLPISEIFVSLQGEGPFSGRRALFIRFFGCNLRCSWCDTKYSYYGKPKVLTDLDVFDDFIILTGGEPTLYQDILRNFLTKAKSRGSEILVETNGTVLLKDHFVDYVDYFSISPKLSNAGVKYKVEIVKKNVEKLMDEEKFYYLKFPVMWEDDLDEVRKMVEYLGVEKSKVWLQPINNERIDYWWDVVVKEGYNLSIQLHKFVSKP